MGLEHVKEVLEDAKTRNELNARLDQTLKDTLSLGMKQSKVKIKDKYYQTSKVTVNRRRKKMKKTIVRSRLRIITPC